MSTATIVEKGTGHRNDIASSLEQIKSEHDVQSLLSQMNDCLALTADSIMKIGAIVRRLEQLEVDVSSLRIPNMDYFRRIAHGSMLPGVFVSLAGSPLIMRRVSRLPIPDQQKIVNGEPVKVILRGGDHMMISVDNMTTKQTKQVFAVDHIRSDSQQAAWLVADEQSIPANTERPPVMLDRRRNGIVIGEVFVSASDLAKYLGDLAEK